MDDLFTILFWLLLHCPLSLISVFGDLPAMLVIALHFVIALSLESFNQCPPQVTGMIEKKNTCIDVCSLLLIF
jgi:hypothetical protein